MILARAPKAVVFDMDGLLVDTEAAYRDAMILTAREMGHDLPVSVFLSMVGLPFIESDRLAQAYFGDDFSVTDFNSAVDEKVGAKASAGLPLKPGAQELVGHLLSLGLPKAIATSSSRRAVDAHLGPTGLLAFFDAVICAGDYTHGKPHPDPYLAAAARLGIDPSDCLALEDSHNGVRSASAAGMMTVMVPDLLDATGEMRGLCVHIATDLHEVQRMISASRLPPAPRPAYSSRP